MERENLHLSAIILIHIYIMVLTDFFIIRSFNSYTYALYTSLVVLICFVHPLVNAIPAGCRRAGKICGKRFICFRSGGYREIVGGIRKQSFSPVFTFPAPKPSEKSLSCVDIIIYCTICSIKTPESEKDTLNLPL